MQSKLNVEVQEYIRQYSTKDNWKTSTQIVQDLGLSCTTSTINYFRTNNNLSFLNFSRYCLQCKKEFVPKMITSKFCSALCRKLYNCKGGGFLEDEHIKRVCHACGKRFIVSKNHKLYCSEECMGKTLRVCHQCGKEFRGKFHKYCSNKCRRKFRRLMMVKILGKNLLNEKEMKFIEKNSTKENWKTANEVATILKRKTSAISAYRSKCHIKCPFRKIPSIWTPEREELLKKYSGKNRIPARELAKIINKTLPSNMQVTLNAISGARLKFGFTIHHIHAKRHQLGLVQNNSNPKKEYICEQCGEPFLAYESSKNIRFCSRPCYEESSRIIKKCNNCGKIFKITKSRNGADKARFCCRKCYDNYRHIHHIVSPHSHLITAKEIKEWTFFRTFWKIVEHDKLIEINILHNKVHGKCKNSFIPQVTVICKNCGTEFKELDYTDKNQFCCRKCQYEYRKKVLVPSQKQREHKMKVNFFGPLFKVAESIKVNHHDIYLEIIHTLSKEEYSRLRSILSKKKSGEKYLTYIDEDNRNI